MPGEVDDLQTRGPRSMLKAAEAMPHRQSARDHCWTEETIAIDTLAHRDGTLHSGKVGQFLPLSPLAPPSFDPCPKDASNQVLGLWRALFRLVGSDEKSELPSMAAMPA